MFVLCWSRVYMQALFSSFFGLGSGCVVPAPPRSNVLRTHAVVGEDLFLCPCIGLFLSLSVDCFVREEVNAARISCT
jgi:hypothetical protein